LRAVREDGGSRYLLFAGLAMGLTPGKAIATAGELFDSPALFELCEHFVKRPRVGLLEPQAPGDVVRGGGVAPKL
jgi:hypothetical protein